MHISNLFRISQRFLSRIASHALFRVLFVVVFLMEHSFLLDAQNNPIKESTAFINFGLLQNSEGSDSLQPVSLFGCNTIITMMDSTYWHGTKGLKWNTANQVLAGIPFGYQTDTSTRQHYYVSKYYIASPPVFKRDNVNNSTLYDIGLVVPDEFVLEGEKPAQLVYLNYDVLKPMYIQYFDVKFDKSFERLNHHVVPFKVVCNDFPWTDQNQLPGARGASGIGALDMNSKFDQRLFLPYYINETEGKSVVDTTFLDCQVTILNDILLNYKVHFEVKGKHGCKKRSTSINLREFKDQNITITLHCTKQRRPPCGCREPKKHNP
jgi:hypothetical protein